MLQLWFNLEMLKISAGVSAVSAAIFVLASNVAMAQLRVDNVNAIHELYGENELAAKNKYHNKSAIVTGRVDRVDGTDLIIEGNSEFGRLFCKFTDLDLDKILELREDDRVSVQGTLRIEWSFFGMSLYMNDCRVL